MAGAVGRTKTRPTGEKPSGVRVWNRMAVPPLTFARAIAGGACLFLPGPVRYFSGSFAPPEARCDGWQMCDQKISYASVAISSAAASCGATQLHLPLHPPDNPTPR